jgi:hypothetical protein
MTITIPGPFRFNSEYLLRRCGYGKLAKRTGEVSYVRVLGRSGFPRFHAYVEGDGIASLRVNVHLDQKQPTYGDHTAHSGDYEGPVVEQEAARIQTMLLSMKHH